jgi:hypothetical protein
VQLAAWTLFLSSSACLAQATYYVSPTGNDNANGLTPATAWASLSKVDSTSYAPGTNILFQSGGVWQGQLSASSSGTVGNPITYGSYGSGANPTFMGSNVLSNSQFSLVPGTTSTYEIQSSQPIYSVLASGNFLHSSALLASSATDPATNVAYVNANPNSWFYNTASDTLYVNSGTSIPSDPRQFTGVVQDDLVYSNYQSNIVFKNLVTDESAKYNAGYGFRVQGGANVSIINCEADRAGKHNFGVINSTGFVGNGITAQYAMPDQGVGGATALVSYSDGSVSNTTSSWSNVNVSNMGGYPAWYSHGDGLGPVSLTNFKTNGAVISMSANTTLTNATVINTGIQIYDDATVNGATLIGGGISLGANAVAKNIFIQDYVNSGTSYPSPIVVTGPNASLSLSTITISQTVQQWVALISMVGANSSLTMTGNVFDTGAQTYLGFQWATPVTPQNLISDYTLPA